MTHSVTQVLFRDLNQRSAAFTIVTANLRQSRTLRSRLADPDKKVQSLHPVYSIGEWIAHLWMERQLSLDSESFLKILNKNESMWAWRKAVKLSDSKPPLLDDSSLARQLAAAESIFEQYQLNLDENVSSYSDETRFFLQVLSLKRKICRDWKALTTDQAALSLIHHADKPTNSQDPIYTYGFVELPPLYQRLIQSISKHEVRELQDEDVSESCTDLVAPNDKEEIQHAVQWARRLLDKSDDKEIAIVIPDLNARYDLIRRKMQRALEPESYLETAPQAPSLFDVSIGDSLWSLKLIRDAMTLLKLFDREISLEHADALISSPYWGNQSGEERAGARRRLRRYASLSISVSSFIQLFQINATNEAQEAYAQGYLSALRSRKQQAREKRRVAEWVDWLLGSLQIVGWPGKQILNSIEYQHAQAFVTLLNELVSFESLESSPLSFGDFRLLVEESCINKTAQIELKKPRIRIMGLMEAAGQPFDHCLILGMTDSNFPLPAKPNPFLPLALQKASSTPRSSAEREMRYAKKLLNSIKMSTRHLVLSRARVDDLGETRPSPIGQIFIDSEGAFTSSYSPEPIGIDKTISSRLNFSEFDYISPGAAPEIAKGSLIKGGISHLNAYWNNPLFSFFQYRLGVDKLPITYIGLSPIVRGQLYHQSLEKLYLRYDSQKKLHAAMSSDQFEQTLNGIIEACWQDHVAVTGVLSATVERHEKYKLLRSIKHWVELDTARRQAFTIQSLEQKVRLDIDGYFVDMRIDRIDEVESTYTLVIDYKTNKNQLSSISKNSTSDFQLPLYALSQEKSGIEGVAFAELDSSQAKFTGVCSASIHIPGIQEPAKIRGAEIPATWEDTLIHWRGNAHALLKALSAGEVPYLPRNKSKAAYFAHFEHAVRDNERKFIYDK